MKKKILLLSDDLRMNSGISTMSRELILGTVHEYDWVQIGGAINHPDKGKAFILDDQVQKETGVSDAKLKIIATDGYGNPQLLRHVLITEKPDAILHFTDPRFWGWLYQMEHELRQQIPLMYWNIWDDVPFPYWNEPFYESCDLLMGISKQTVNINKHVVRKFPKPDWAIKYVPHGINPKTYYPIDSNHESYDRLKDFKFKVFDGKDYDFVVLYANRNIKRKHPSDVILAFKHFCDTLSTDDARKCALVMHTAPRDPNGTDLIAVADNLCPEYNVIFTKGHVDVTDMNLLYNMADVTINMASNEGFGLTTAESLMSGTPIVVNVTGGLQDQCGFEDHDGNLIGLDHMNSNWSSNHDKKYTKHGVWVRPIYPVVRTCQGSVPTPYIFDDICRFEDAAQAIADWYKTSTDKRIEAGLYGREFLLHESNLNSVDMCRMAVEAMNTCFNEWEPRKRFDIYDPDQISETIPTHGYTPMSV